MLEPGKIRQPGGAVQRSVTRNFIGGEWVRAERQAVLREHIHAGDRGACSARSRARPRKGDIGPCARRCAPRPKAAWGKRPRRRRRRANILNKIADRMEQKPADAGRPQEDLGQTASRFRETTHAEHAGLAVDHFRYFRLVRACVRQEGGVSEIDHETYAYHFPRSRSAWSARFIPWKLPDPGWRVVGSSHRHSPRATASCSSRPSRRRCRSSCWMELIADLLPPGVLNIVNGFRSSRPASLSRRATASAKIAFTRRGPRPAG